MRRDISPVNLPPPPPVEEVGCKAIEPDLPGLVVGEEGRVAVDDDGDIGRGSAEGVGRGDCCCC
jgi:hypothetical protein